MLSSSMNRRPPSQIFNQMSELGARIRTILAMAIESGAMEIAIRLLLCGLRTLTARRLPKKLPKLRHQATRWVLQCPKKSSWARSFGKKRESGSRIAVLLGVIRLIRKEEIE
jgi:hypothetical protein